MNKGAIVRIAYLAWFLMLCLTTSFALAAEKPANLMGRWNCQGEDGVSILEFQSGNQLVYDGEANIYRLQHGAIMVQGMWGEEAYRYRLKGHRLDVTFPEGETIQCSRENASGKQRNTTAPSAGGSTASLRGRLCQWSGSSSSYSGSSYSRTASIDFDGQGNVVYGSESSFSGNAGSAYGGSGGTRGSYRVDGESVSIHLEDGSQVVAQVSMRQNDGRITELMANGKLWATGLCQ